MPRSRRMSPRPDAMRISRPDGMVAVDDDTLSRDLTALQTAVEPFGIPFDDAVFDRLATFGRELVSWNERHNLLSRMDVQNVITKHVAASLGVFLLADPIPGQRWIDVGSGAGFPGMVLKLVRPDIDITLLDSSKKRCEFLDHIVRTIDLKQVQVLPMRAETLLSHRGGRKGFDVLTSRAVASLEDSMRNFGGLLGPGGRFITFKGPNWMAEVENAISKGAFRSSGLSMESVARVPWTQSHLLMLRADVPIPR